MQILNLSVETREGSGKGPSRRTRAAGQVPGVIYGEGQEAVSVTFDARRFQFDVVNKGGEPFSPFLGRAWDPARDVAAIALADIEVRVRYMSP